MKKKIKLTNSLFQTYVIFFAVLLLITIAFAIFVILVRPKPILPLYIILAILCFCLLITVFGILKYCVYWLIVDKNGLVIKCVFGAVKTITWSKIDNIYIFNFESANKIRTDKLKNRRINVGGVLINIPKKIPKKWIFIDEGNGDSGENIFEYFVPLRKTLPIRLKYSEEIMTALNANYSKSITEKTIL